MSFNGFFFVARCEQPIFELPSIRHALGTTPDGAPMLDEIDCIRRDGPWQQMQCKAEFMGARAIVADTASPALVIFTFESSIADVRGASPEGEDWFAILSPDGGQEYRAPDPGPAPEVAARAAAWAVEAGLTPDRDRILAAIGTRPGPFSEGIEDFVQGLGFRFGPRELVPENG